jgi:hypothetical protein
VHQIYKYLCCELITAVLEAFPHDVQCCLKSGLPSSPQPAEEARESFIRLPVSGQLFCYYFITSLIQQHQSSYMILLINLKEFFLLFFSHELDSNNTCLHSYKMYWCLDNIKKVMKFLTQMHGYVFSACETWLMFMK